MVKLFFGLPGCGKTTILCKLAYDALKAKGKKKRYKNVYSNVFLGTDSPFDKVIYIDNSMIGTHEIRDGLVLIDEATIAFDSRDFKSMSKNTIQYFLLHRHYNVDIVVFSQQWDGIDRKIRIITDQCFYVYKGFWLGKWISSYYRIPYGIIIPDGKGKNGDSKLGEIVQGYAKPSILQRIFCTRVFRPKYYRYFDSWQAPVLKPIDDRTQELVLRRFVSDSMARHSDCLCERSEL